MSFSSNIIYFYEKTSIKILFDYLNENLCKRSYDLHSLTFDKHVARVPFENSACLIVLDMIEVENVLGMSDKIKEYLKNNHTRLWMNVGRGQIYKYSTNWGVCCGYALDQELSMEPLIKSSKEFPNRIVVSELTKPKESEISLKLIVDYLKLNIKNFDDPNDSIFRFSANFRISEKGFELIENKFDNCEYHPKSKLDFQKISSNLKTRSLGNRIIAFERISSTLDVAESLKSWANNGTDLVIIADQQLSGRGRGDNKWISNLGCLMMTIVHPLPSHLPPTLIQHVLALAAVESIIEIRKIPLFIKWPNDIYYKNELKIGGVLVKLCVCDDKKILISSIGININNSLPTTCVNDIIEKRYGSSERTEMEVYIANILNHFEWYLNDVPLSTIISHYKEHWLHRNAEVNIETIDGIKAARITGIDNYGFLALDIDGQTVTAHPDGNSFDLMKNLIINKN